MSNSTRIKNMEKLVCSALDKGDVAKAIGIMAGAKSPVRRRAARDAMFIAMYLNEKYDKTIEEYFDGMGFYEGATESA